MIRLLATSAIVAVGAGAAVAGPITAPEAPPPVVIDTPSGNWYGVLALGYVPETTASGEIDVGSIVDLDIDIDPHWLLSGAVGYEMPSGLRGELEVIYAHGDLGSYSIDGGGPDPLDGDFAATLGMLNAWYSFGGGSISPFIGGGIGLAHVSMDDPGVALSSSDTVHAWQIGLGADIALSDDMSLVVMYRMINLNDIEGSAGGDDFSVDYQNHIVTAGVRFSF